MIILGIDTGSTKSAYCAIDGDTDKPIAFAKISNADLTDIVRNEYYDALGVEGFACYGARIGQETFDAAYVVGRIQQLADDRGTDWYMVLRRQVKKCLLGKSSGKDCNDKAVRQALIDKYGEWTEGMTYDVFSAYAIATTLAKELRERAKDSV